MHPSVRHIIDYHTADSAGQQATGESVTVPATIYILHLHHDTTDREHLQQLHSNQTRVAYSLPHSIASNDGFLRLSV